MHLIVPFPSSPHAEVDRLSLSRPANDEGLHEQEKAHRIAVHDELRALESRLLLRLARGALSVEVWVPGSVPTRRNLFDLLVEQRRLLIVGGRASGKTALVSLLTAQTAWRELSFGLAVPIFVACERLEQVHLDETEIGRLNPVLGADGIRDVMAAGRGLLIVDGLDEARAPDALKASIVALARAYPSSRFVVTTRSLPPKIAGKSETSIDGFLAVRIAAPEAAGVASIADLDEHRFPARWAERVAGDVQVLVDTPGPPGGFRAAPCSVGSRAAGGF